MYREQANHMREKASARASVRANGRSTHTKSIEYRRHEADRYVATAVRVTAGPHDHHARGIMRIHAGVSNGKARAGGHAGGVRTESATPRTTIEEPDEPKMDLLAAAPTSRRPKG